jgi:hypothetical protein
VVANRDRPNQLRSGADIDVTAEARHTAFCRANGHLLEKEAIGTDLGIWVDNDSIRMGDEETARDFAAEWDISARHHRPEAMAEHRHLGAKTPTTLPRTLMIPDALEQRP